MENKRRDFLKSTLLGTAAALSPNISAPAEEAPVAKNPFSDDPVAIRKLTEAVSATRVGLGTGMRGGGRQSDLTRLGKEKATELVLHCYDSGVRLFDLADMYGTHQVVGEALRGKPRDSFTIVSKIWGHPGGIPDEDHTDAVTSVERFLKEIGTDYIDLVQIHCMNKPDWPDEFGRFFDDLEKLKERGLIKAHGVSCHGLEAARVAATHPWVDALHIRMNTADARMDGTLDENIEVARLAQKNGKGIIVMKVLGEGAIQDPTEQKKSIKMVTRLDATDVMVVGFTAIDQVDFFLTSVAEALKD